MTAVICIDKKLPEEQGLEGFKDYLNGHFPSYQDFLNDLLGQLNSGVLDPTVKDLLEKHIRDSRNAFNLNNFSGDVNNYAAAMGADGVVGTLQGLSKAKFPPDLFAYANMQKIVSYSTEYAKLGLYLGVTEATSSIFNSEHPVDEAGKQSLKLGLSTVVALGVAEGLTAGGLLLLGATAAPVIGLAGAAVTGGAALVGALAGVKAGNVIEYLWDNIVRNANDAKINQLTEQQAIQKAINEILEDAKALYDEGGLGNPDDAYGPDSPFCIPLTPTRPTDQPLGSYLPDMLGPLSNIPKFIFDTFTTPLILDLDGDGAELLQASKSVYWDIDNDGFAEASGWVGKDDGLLVLDDNKNGRIEYHQELFGSAKSDGFTELEGLDSNWDRVIDANDARFGELRVWKDANSDAVTQAGELYTLAELGIKAISLDDHFVDQAVAGNKITNASNYIKSNGQLGTIVDAWFGYDEANSVYRGDYTLDIRTLFLPTLRGYGELPDLHIAMSKDATLLNLVQTLATTDAATLLSKAFNLGGKIEAILFRWAGADAVTPDSRGENVDARHLAFVEKFLGQPLGTATVFGQDPILDTLAGPYAEQAFENAFDALYARIVAQLPGAAGLFTQIGAFNPIADTLDGTYKFNLTNLKPFAPVKADGIAVVVDKWHELFGMMHAFGALDKLTVSEKTTINGWIKASDPNGALTFAQFDALVKSEYDHQASSAAKYGTTGNNTLLGMRSHDKLYGEAGNDTLLGHMGDDYLYGGDGTDVSYGGPGNDVLYGDAGNDTLYGEEGSDSFDGGIGDDKLYGGAGDDYMAGGDGNDKMFGDSGNDYLDGNAGNNTLEGGDGDDQLFGWAGNDTLDGGAGNDALQGGAGTNTFIYNSGRDIIRTYGGADTVKFAAGFALADMTTKRSGDDLVISFKGIETLTIQNHFMVGWAVEKFTFSDGKTFNPVAVNSTVDGTDGNDFLYGLDFPGGKDTLSGLNGDDMLWGYAGTDTLNGGAGADRLDGGDGNDILDGGLGADQLVGGAGDDTYVIDNTDDTITDVSGTDIVKSSVSHALASDIENLTLTGSAAINGTGNALANTVTGNSGKNLLNGGASDDTLIGGGGNDTFFDDQGNDTFTGGAGADLFKFAGAFGKDQITDFQFAVAGEKIDLSAVAAIISFADLKANHLRQGATGAVIDDGSGNMITLLGINAESLTSSNFVF